MGRAEVPRMQKPRIVVVDASGKEADALSPVLAEHLIAHARSV